MTLPENELSEHCVSFGSFRLFPVQRVLLDGERPLKLGSRAFDILAVLLERAGETIGKAELIARVWPHTVVEEGNLRVHVAALRKALRCGQEQRYINNVAGRGYCFIAPVQRHVSHSLPPVRPAQRAASGLYGRDEAVAQLTVHLQQHRLVSLVGAGGVGKTAVALEAARALAPQLPYCLVELAAIEQPERLLPAVSHALGLGVQPLPALLQHLRERRLLLMLDSCEHLIDHAAALAEQLLPHAPELRILATSREALRAAGEWVQRLRGLPLPPPTVQSAQEALQWPAVALFVERAQAVRSGFTLQDADVAPLLQLCGTLDGLPLAIELAAARLDMLTVADLAARSGERFQLLNRGRRTAPPRHQSLLATLEWSFRPLSDTERRVLCRLALWHGPFDIATGNAIACAEDLAPPDVEDAVVSLAARSLLETARGEETLLCQVPDCVGLYGRLQLNAQPGAQAARARHLAACAARLAPLEADWERESGELWRQRYAPLLPNVREALAWCFGAGQRAEEGTALLLASHLLWVELDLLGEQRGWLERALAAEQRDPVVEMKLHGALGNALFHLHGGAASAAAFASAFAIAETRGDIHQLSLAFSGLSWETVIAGDYAAARQLAARYQDSIRYAGSRAAQQVHDRMAALALHLSGEQAEAERLAQLVMEQRPATPRRTRASAVHYDPYVAAGVVLARARWLRGFPEQAHELAQAAAVRARQIGDRISASYALAAAVFPVAWWNGDRTAAAAAQAALASLNPEHARSRWHGCAQRYAALLAGQPPSPLAECATGGLGPQAETLATLDGRYLDAALPARVDDGYAAWCAPEVLRLQGDAELADGGTGAARRAEHLYRQALSLARSQQALSWELRCASSLAALWQRDGSTEAARELLDGVLARFTEGFGTADLRSAAALLAQMENAAVLRRARRRHTTG